VTTVPAIPDDTRWELPYPAKAGMWSLIAAESAIFVILITAYVFYIGKSLSGPTPEILSPPLFLTACLLSSSVTIDLAIRSLKRGRSRAFALLWFLTFVLGAIFLGGTALEWRRLIMSEGLTISTNLFGTTYYSLVGLHGCHVIVGLFLLGLVTVFASLGKVTREYLPKLEVLALYWHFVDVVWVFVFTLVYVVGR
jgi:cytochrome c oxidase subunit 3